METTEVLVFAGYQELEAAGDRTAAKIKEGYMEMGYILKTARDTDILAGSGYRGYEEFAEKRYGMDKGTVSRYIRIVERFSVGGNSHVLQDNYRDMGFSKLSIMLHMPDAVAEELMASLSKTEVAAIREEIEAEGQVSDIELAIEASERQEPEGTLLEKTVLQIGKEQPEIYQKLWNMFRKGEGIYARDVLAPQGDAVYMARIPGTGRMMLAISDQGASVTSIRTQEKEKYSIEELIEAAEKICRTGGETAEESYRLLYGEELEKEPEPKPAGRPGTEPPKKEKRKESRVVKARPEKPKKPRPEKAGEPEEEQLPGQMSLEDYEGVVSNAGEIIPGTGAVELSAEREEIDGEKETGGETGGDLAVGGQEGSPAAGADSGPAGEPDAGHGAAEGGGCEEDSGDGKHGLTDDEQDDIWMEIADCISEIEDFKRKYRWDELDQIPPENLREAYGKAVDLAAYMEKLLIARGGEP